MMTVFPRNQFAAALSAGVVFTFLLSACSPKTQDIPLTAQIDSAINIYGPYRIVKLPIVNSVLPSNPIQLSLGSDGFVYASNQTGEVYSLRDTDGDGLEDTGVLFCNVRDFGLRSPAGLAWRGDTLYIGTSQQIRLFMDRDKDGKADTSWVFFDKIPNSEHPYEWTSGLIFGPDQWLYVALTTDSWNAAPSPDPEGYRGSIIRISSDGEVAEKVVTGIRSVHSMAFHPGGDLFFVDNEGGGNPNEELNLAVKGKFYGHNPGKYPSSETEEPVHVLTSEVAPSGIAFNAPDNNFGGTAGNLFVAFYGAGERWSRGALASVSMRREPDGKYSFKEDVIADIPKLSDLTFGKDGSLYLAQHGKADYWYNAIYENEGAFYKMVYDPSLNDKPRKTRPDLTASLSESAVETGKQLYAEYACLACHAVDGVTELLGPNLKDVTRRLNREEILMEIEKPSERIKPSMMGVRVIKKDGQTLIGRVINASDTALSLMLVGNQVVHIGRDEIARTENETKSLMYEGLLTGLSPTDREALLDYLTSLSQ